MQTLEESSERLEEPRNSPFVSVSAQDDMVAQGARARLRQSLFGVEGPPPTIGRFVFLRSLGAGGMGTVSGAYDPTLRREVAIKVVRRQGDARAQQRLVREAQAMAKVKHPNVIAVYEVGELGDAVFIAMELVDGPNLHVWGQREHGPGERLAAVLQAAEGLAAAHAAGLVHCDFKPQNCIIDDAGRVRVVDFGLARALADVPTLSGAVSGPGVDTATVGSGGTPRYMAPEQARGETVDARSDQFSFGVSAFELLVRRHPFGAESGNYDPREGGTGEIDWGDAEVPRHVREVLARALQPDPQKRFGSMTALVEALRVDPTASRRVLGMVAATAGVAVVGGAVGFSSASGEPAETCDVAALERAWSPERSARVEAAFSERSVPYADRAWRGVQSALDDHAAGLREGLVSVCAVAERDPQSVRTAALRRECLDQRTRELEASVAVLEDADDEVVRNWTKVVDGLGSLARCEDVAELLAAEVVPPPPEQAEAVESLSARMARADALRIAGKQEEALAIAEQALVDARATAYGPIVARALMNVSDSHRFARKAAEARPLVEEALAVAVRSDDHEIAFNAAAAMVWIAGTLETDDEGVRAWSTVAEALLERLGSPPRLRFMWLTTQASVAAGRGKGAEVLALFEERAALVRTHPESDPSPGRGESDLATALWFAGKLPEAYTKIQEVLEHDAERLGREHPDYARSLVNAGGIAGQLRRDEESLQYLEEADRILRRALPPDHPDLAKVSLSIGGTLGQLGRDEEVVPLMEATLDALAKTFPEDHPLVAQASSNLAGSLAELGRTEEARAAYTRALAIFEARYGAEHPETKRAAKGLADLE